ADRDDRILDGHVSVDRDVVDVDDGRSVDDDVVDDARAAPAGPPGSAHEAGRAPPWHHGLAPAERDPADHGRAGAHRDPGGAEERDESGTIHGPGHDGPRRPRPKTIDDDPATIVVGRPPPGSGIDPRPAIARIREPPAGAVGHPP